MKFKRILQSVTGVSTPIFGIQWTPPHWASDLAEETLVYLSDKRVLFNRFDMEDAGHCIQSVDNVRNHLERQRGKLQGNKELDKSLAAMQRACRRFMDYVGHPKYSSLEKPIQESILENELQRLRSSIGKQVATLSISFGVDVEDELASIITFNNIENA
ncbi:DUF6650 family protein [Guyparkeria sp. GHLCS8-2]|uniref:DUF6650 family protein n=1 Tax=Guyparkeria halopsychrophila TaxID=3139421 RepID=UPI0037C86B4C